MRVVVVADTHAPRRWKGCPPGLAAALETRPDLILHAGDVCTVDVLGLLRGFAPVTCVLGNNDGAAIAAAGATHRWQGELDGVRVAMVHDSGARDGRPARLRRWFPDADLVVFGHSHIPWDTTHPELGLRLLNPGSATDPRRQPFGTFAEVVLDAGRIVSVSIDPA